jgi:hypothetical protein
LFGNETQELHLTLFKIIPQIQGLVIALVVTALWPSMLRSQETYHLEQYTFGKFRGAIETIEQFNGEFPGQRLTITRGSRIIFQKDGHRWYFYLRKPVRLLPDGSPVVIFYEWSGGAHCCITSYFLELVERVRKPVVLGPRDCEAGLYLKRNRKTGVMRVTVCDDVFALQCSGCWPRPPVVLEFSSRDHRFHIATQVMRRRLAPASLGGDESSDDVCKAREKCSWNEVARRLKKRNWFGWNAWKPDDLWSSVIALIYAGQAKQAFRLLDQAWGLDSDKKEEMKTQFIRWLACSRYFDDLVGLNRGHLPRADCKVPRE